jgi:hypothetical protein
MAQRLDDRVVVGLVEVDERDEILVRRLGLRRQHPVPVGPPPRAAEAGLRIGAEVPEGKAAGLPRRVASWPVMGAFDQLARRLPAFDPTPPVWRMRCRCAFKAGRPGQIAACGCRFWWRASRRGQWYAISKRRAFRTLLPELTRALGHFEATGAWPAD